MNVSNTTTTQTLPASVGNRSVSATPATSGGTQQPDPPKVGTDTVTISPEGAALSARSADVTPLTSGGTQQPDPPAPNTKG